MAVPNPEHELQRCQQLAKKPLPKVLLLIGVAEWFRLRGLAALQQAIPAEAEVRRVDGNDDTDGSELLDLRGGGLFARAGWLVVRNGDGWLKRHHEALLAALPKIAGGCGLLLEANKLDRRTKGGKALAEAGELFEFRELYDMPFDRSRGPLESELNGFVVRLSRALGVPLSPQAALLVTSQVGKEPGAIHNELQVLRSQLGADGKRAPLQPGDLRGRLSCQFTSTPFEFADALLDRDRRAAERSLAAMFEHGVKARDGGTMDTGGLFPFITSWLFTRLCEVHRGRTLLDQGVAPRDLAARLGVHRFGERLVAQVQRNRLDQLRLGLLALLHSQRALRTTGEGPELLLGELLRVWFGDQPVATHQELEW